MAQRVVTQLVSDLSGEEITDGSGETIAFSFRGVSYTIDLTDQEAAAFESSIATYLENATKVGGRRKTAAATTGSGDYNAKDVRAWAKSAGLDVPDRGRIPSGVLDEYKAAH